MAVLFCFVASAQYTPTGSKTRFVNGIGLGTKSDAAFGVADSLVLYASGDSSLKFKYKGTAKPIQYKVMANVKDYGAKGDGATNDLAAFTAALASGYPVIVPFGKYYVSSTITVATGKIIQGFGDSSIIYVNGDYPAITIGGNNTNVSGLKIMGNGRGTVTNYATTRPLQDGIYIYTLNDGKQGNRITNVTFDSLGNSGINYVYNYRAGREYGLSVSNVYSFKCFIGFKAGETAEFATWTNVAADSCQYGAWIQGGNNILNGGNLSNNRTNLYLKKGTNDGHASITGFMLNHALDKSVWADSLGSGYTISNSMLYYGDIYVTNSTGIKFNNCDIRPGTVTYINSTLCTFENTYWVNTPTFSFSGTLPRFFGNTWATATPGTGVYNSINDSLQVTGGAWMKKQLSIGNGFHLSTPHSLYVSTEGSYNPPRFERHFNPSGTAGATAVFVYAAETSPITAGSGQTIVFQAVNATRTQFFNMGQFQWLYKQFDSTRPYTEMRLNFQDSSDYRNSLDLADNTPYFDFYPKWRTGYSYAFMGGGYANARNKPLAFGTRDSSIVFIDTTFRVGINNTSPSHTLDVTGSFRSNAARIDADNSWFANYAVSANAAQFQAWYNSGGSRRGYMGYASGGDNTWSIVNEATNGGIVITPNGSGTTTISSLGTGTVQATSGVLSIISDSRLKNKLGYFTNATDAIMKLAKPQYWKYSAKSKLPKEAQKVKQFGLMADNVHKILGEQFAPTQKNGYYGLSDRALLGLAIQAIQELKAEIEQLKKK